jgi:hypothetical protein
MVPSEESEQIATIEWLWSRGFFAFHVPNGIKVSIAKAMRLKAMGLLSGIPDIIIVMPEEKVLWLEMKKQKGGVVSPNQQAIHHILTAMGHKVLIAKGNKDAKDQLSRILSEGDRAHPRIAGEQGIVQFPAVLGKVLRFFESQKRK